MLFSLKHPNTADKRTDFARAVALEWSQTPHLDNHPGRLCASLSHIIQTCAKQVFGVRSSGTSTPYAIVRMRKIIQRLISDDPLWWVNPSTVAQVARARARVRALWDIQLAAQRLGLKLDRSTVPSRTD